MSKRGAEEYITKEHGSTPNEASEGIKVKMATAAQLAKRKMAVPKSRAGRTGQSSMPGAPTSNPFAGNNLFGASQNNSQASLENSVGVKFGASQSFPAGDSAPSSGFTFSMPGQSNSFTFGQPVSNNPFASLNGTSSSQPPLNQESNDTIMESPQKKPAMGSNVFGSMGNQNNVQSAPFTFGQSTTQPPSEPAFSFGKSQGFGSAPSSTSFGQTVSKPPEPIPTTNIFGQSIPAQNSTAAVTTSTGFGQNPDPLPPSTQPSGFNFGQSSGSAPSSTPAFAFGQTSTQAPSSTPLFGDSSRSSSQSLGSSGPASQPASSVPLFGATPSTSSSNPFGGFGSMKPTEPNRPAEVNAAPNQSQSKPFSTAPKSSTNSLDQGKQAPAAQDTPKSNPFAGLFAQDTSKQTEPSMASALNTSKPLFGFTAPSQPSGLFAAPKTVNGDTPSKSSEGTAKKPPFSFGAPAATSNSSLFSPSKEAAETKPFANPFAGLSAKKSETSEPRGDDQSLGFGGDSPNKSKPGPQAPATFGQSLSTPAKSAFSSSVLGSQGPDLFGKSQPSTEQSLAKQTPHKPAVSGLSQSTPSDTLSTAPKTTAFSSDAISSGVEQSEAEDGPKRSVNSCPPTRVPPYLNGDDYKSYDSNYRLHSLNREFQKRIASLDPSQNDFENIVRNYVAARESIGESMGLYTRNMAGMKRKADEGNDRRSDDAGSVKRTKPGEDSPSKQLFGTNQASNAIFQPVPSSASKPSANFMNASSVKPNTTVNNASSLFSSMIPESPSKTGESTSSNPFANLPKSTQTSTQRTSANPPFSFGSSFGTTAATGSTTPTKSPPKKPTFEIPKFAPSGGSNFLDAFKKDSADNAAKFAKDSKAKRKAEDFDSDEDDEEEWNRKYEEEEKAKKAKVAAIAQTGFKPTFGNTAASADKPTFAFGSTNNSTATAPKPAFGSVFGNHAPAKPTEKSNDTSENDASGEDEEDEATGDSGEAENEDEEEDEEEEVDEDDLPEDDVAAEDENDEDEDFESAMARSRSKGRSLFDRVTPNPAMQKASGPTSAPSTGKEMVPKPATFSNVFGKGTPEAPSFSPLTPVDSKESFVPTKTFSFTSTPSTTTSTPVPGASIFAGGPVKEGPIFGEGLFGSRPSTPSNADNPKTSVFGGLGTPATGSGSDHTWKKGFEIKFGTSTTEAPAVSITEPSPQKEGSKPFANLFGANAASFNKLGSNANVGFAFGQSLAPSPASAPAPAPGFLAAASHLTGGSGTNSGMSSRATSPGTTDNESVATNEEDFSHDTQVSLMETRPGEEDENIIFESRARALRWYTEDQIKGSKFTKGWNVVGLGVVRLLKHRNTNKTRVVMRAEPGANIILNANLQPEVKYEFAASGSAGTVKFNVVTGEGIQGWLLKVKTQQVGQDLAKLMEENKKSSA